MFFTKHRKFSKKGNTIVVSVLMTWSYFSHLQVFAMLNLTPYDLSVDTLDVHAVCTKNYCSCKCSRCVHICG